MSRTTGKLPSHRAYAVSESNGKRFWREIGAAWSHGDGDGFSLKLDLLPLNDAEIVIRKVTADSTKPDPADVDEETPPERGRKPHRARAASPEPG